VLAQRPIMRFHKRFQLFMNRFLELFLKHMKHHLQFYRLRKLHFLELFLQLIQIDRRLIQDTLHQCFIIIYWNQLKLLNLIRYLLLQLQLLLIIIIFPPHNLQESLKMEDFRLNYATFFYRIKQRWYYI